MIIAFDFQGTNHIATKIFFFFFFNKYLGNTYDVGSHKERTAAAAAAAAKSFQSCPTLCDSIDSSPPGSAVPGILQARTLEWVAISFSIV